MCIAAHIFLWTGIGVPVHWVGAVKYCLLAACVVLIGLIARRRG